MTIFMMRIFIATKQTIAHAWTTPSLSFEEVTFRIQGTFVNEKLTAISIINLSYGSPSLITLLCFTTLYVYYCFDLFTLIQFPKLL